MSPQELARLAAVEGLTLTTNRDLGRKYDVVGLNYNHYAPPLPKPSSFKRHQGFLGSIGRRILMVRGVMEYRLLVFRKGELPWPPADAVQMRRLAERGTGGESGGGGGAVGGGKGGGRNGGENGKQARPRVKIKAQLMDGNIRGSRPMVSAFGSQPAHRVPSSVTDHGLLKGRVSESCFAQPCLSAWYCCGKGTMLWDDMQANRTDSLPFLRLPRSVFGDCKRPLGIEPTASARRQSLLPLPAPACTLPDLDGRRFPTVSDMSVFADALSRFHSKPS